MSLFHNSAIVGSSGQGGYLINQSLRFNPADSARLYRTLAASQTRTYSFWYKYANLSGGNMYLFHHKNSGDTNYIGVRSGGSPSENQWQTLNQGSSFTQIFVSGVKFRDPSAWQHFVFKCTGSNVTQYINGVEYGSTGGANISLSGGTLEIGARGSAEYFGGYIAEFHFVDGTAYNPSDFGETDAITGAWIPKRFGGTYGSNGAYLKFDPTATNGIGHDHSGNGNNFTATGFSTSGTGTDVMSDTPTNNFPTLNPIYVTPPYPTQTQNATLSDGNLAMTFTGVNGGTGPTFAELPTSGKWYFEAKQTSADNTNISIGFYGRYTANFDNAWRIVHSNGGAGFFYSFQGPNSGAEPSGTTAYSSGNILGIEIDMDNATLQFHVNGTYATKATGLTFSGYTPLWIDFRRQNSTGTNNSWLFNFGQRAFEYTPTSGFKALSTANLPEPTIKKGSIYFNAVAYSGSSSNQAITVGFEPDFLWIKRRNGANDHNLYNAIVGLTGNYLVSNSTGGENGNNNRIVATSSTGFTVGTGSADTNGSGNTYIAWAWDANGAGSSNTAGTITSTVSANTTAGFSIVTWTGTGADGSYGHGLGVQPSMIIHKRRNSTSDWHVWHKGLPTKSPTNDVIYLNLTDAQNGGNNNLFRLDPTSTLIYTGSAGSHNVNGATYVDYVFSEVAGYSKFGSYTGNNNSDGPFVYLGFKPALLIIKSSTSGENWHIKDSTRDTYNPIAATLLPNAANSELNLTNSIDLLSNGFKIRSNSWSGENSSNTFIYAAFAEHPFKYANAR